MVGCVVFVIYAVLIQSLSVCIINGACFILHIVKLVQMYVKKKKGNVKPRDDASNEQIEPKE